MALNKRKIESISLVRLTCLTSMQNMNNVYWPTAVTKHLKVNYDFKQ